MKALIAICIALFFLCGCPAKAVKTDKKIETEEPKDTATPEESPAWSKFPMTENNETKDDTEDE